MDYGHCQMITIMEAVYQREIYRIDSYTYSAGLTVATQICRRIEQEKECAVEDWKNVLAAGSTLNPVGLAKLAGIDVATDEPLLDTIAYIGEIIDEIERLTDSMGELL